MTAANASANAAATAVAAAENAINVAFAASDKALWTKWQLDAAMDLDPEAASTKTVAERIEMVVAWARKQYEERQQQYEEHQRLRRTQENG